MPTMIRSDCGRHVEKINKNYLKTCVKQTKSADNFPGGELLLLQKHSPGQTSVSWLINLFTAHI